MTTMVVAMLLFANGKYAHLKESYTDINNVGQALVSTKAQCHGVKINGVQSYRDNRIIINEVTIEFNQVGDLCWTRFIKK